MKRALSVLSLVAYLFQPAIIYANEINAAPRGKPVAVQGEDVNLPQDLVSRLDDGKLKISLDTLGVPSIVDSDRSSMIVRLIGEDESSSLASVNADGTAEFDNVTADKLHAIVINSPNAHAVVPVMPVSDKVAEEKGVTNTQIRVPLLQASAQEILKNIANYTSASSGGGQAVTPGTPYGPTQIAASTSTVYTIRLTPEGVLNGKVIVPENDLREGLRFANITLLNAGTPVAQTSSNEKDGVFSLVNIQPGRYGLIASGPAGYAAYAVDIVAGKEGVAQLASSKTKLVSANQVVTDVAIVFLVPPSLMPGVVKSVEDDYLPGIPSGDGSVAGVGGPGAPGGFPGGPGFPGGGYPGGYGGGFGGGGMGGGMFGGGWGPLLGLGALGGIAAAIASDDDNDQDNTPIIVSPITQ